MRALITGSGGFVGRYLVRHLLESGDEVLGADRNVKSGQDLGIETVALDVADAQACSQLISEYKPNVIYHLAGIAFVPEAENNFDKALLINVGGTNNIIRSCHTLQNHAKVVYVSSAEVYGRINPDNLPVTESTTIRPANNYSLSKAMAEITAARYEQSELVQTVVMRPFNHVGPGQDRRFVVPAFAEQLAEIAKGKREPVIRVGNLDAQRDFSDVKDIVRAYRLAAEKGQGVYNLCSGNPQPVRWILDTLIEVSGLDVKVELDATRMRPSEVPVLYGSYDKARDELGWEPECDLRETLREVYEDILEAL